GLPDLTEQVTRSIDSTRRWLIEGPLHLRAEQIDNAGNAAIQALHNNQAKLTSGALSTAATITELVTAAVLVLFTLIFFLYGGRNIWQYVVKIFPADVRDRVREGLHLRADHVGFAGRGEPSRGSFAAAPGDGSRGLDPSARGGAGDFHWRRARRDRRCLAGRSDGRVRQ